MFLSVDSVEKCLKICSFYHHTDQESSSFANFFLIESSFWIFYAAPNNVQKTIILRSKNNLNRNCTMVFFLTELVHDFPIFLPMKNPLKMNLIIDFLLQGFASSTKRSARITKNINKQI